MIKAGLLTFTEVNTIATRDDVLDANDTLDALEEHADGPERNIVIPR